MSADHTPTPWEAREQFTKDGASLGWIIEHSDGRIGWSSFALRSTNEGEGEPYPVGTANAAFIVRAVNAHDDLVAAMKETLAVAQRNETGDFELLACRALAKAEAQS